MYNDATNSEQHEKIGETGAFEHLTNLEIERRLQFFRESPDIKELWKELDEIIDPVIEKLDTNESEKKSNKQAFNINVQYYIESELKNDKKDYYNVLTELLEKTFHLEDDGILQIFTKISAIINFVKENKSPDNN